MIKDIKKFQWLKVVFLSLLLVILLGIPSSTLAASTKTSGKVILKSTITYCDKLDKSVYTSKSWTSFQKELKNAKSVYAKKNSDTTYRITHDALEKSKANLMFVTTKDKGNPLVFRELTVDQMVSEMGTGFNLGNTMDGNWSYTPYELAWQGVITTKAYIKKMHDMGFNTIRIPVTYGRAIDDKNDYKISEDWINRVQDIVDYAVSQDMYAIINIHHDGLEQGWLKVAAEDIDPVYEKFEHVWRNIATKFKDYDEHLIFESMNEISGGSAQTGSRDAVVMNNLNQIFVNVIRSTSSNNGKRWFLISAPSTSIDHATNKDIGFQLPTDLVKNRLFVSVHQYEYAFGLLGNSPAKIFGPNSGNTLINSLKKLETTFTSKGIPVIIGEYGAVPKNNDIDRAYYYEALTKACLRYGMVPCMWEFGLVDRATFKENNPLVIDAILRGNNYPLTTDDSSSIVKKPVIKKITKVSLSETSLTMTIGDSKKVTVEVTPKNTNDTLQWATADDTVATVADGHVRARGIGTTTLTVSSRSGSLQKQLTVTVNTGSSSIPCTSIVTDKAFYSVEKGKCIYLQISLMPETTDDYVYYKSSNEAVASVSAIGKVVGCNIGTATITITSSNGITKTVEVAVTEVKQSTEFSVALKVGFGKNEHEYEAEEVGKPIKITNNGQYTVVFDCTTDLSKTAKIAGVTSITDIFGVSIEDYDFIYTNSTQSPLVSCDITYEKILVDGVEMTIVKEKSTPKPGLRGTSGIFETSDLISVWNGSTIEEIQQTGQLINFTTVKNPNKIEVTFTISNLVFK